MNNSALAMNKSLRLCAEELRARVGQTHSAQHLIQVCLQATRTLAKETEDRSILLFYAMMVLGKYPKGTSAKADFTTLFNELGLTECSKAVARCSYSESDLAFYWSSDYDFSRYFEKSDQCPSQDFHTATQARTLPKTIMFDEWGSCPFHEFDVFTDPLPAKTWSLYKIENATIIYDTTEFAVLDASGRPIHDLCSNHFQHVFFTHAFGEHLKRSTHDEAVLCANDGFLDSALMVQDMVPAPNYCHWLLDQLPRARLLKDSQQLIMHKFAPFIKETLDILGIEKQRVVELDKNSILEVRELSIETNIARHWHHPCQEVNSELVEYVRNSLLPDDSNTTENAFNPNVYVSRNRSGRRHISNEDELLLCLNHFDFTVVYLEELSVVEQVRLFRNARVVVAPHGAGLSNIIFCNQASVIEIFNPNYGTASFRLLAQLMDMPYQHIMGKNKAISYADRQQIGRACLQREDIEVDIGLLEQCLSQIFCSDSDANTREGLQTLNT